MSAIDTVQLLRYVASQVVNEDMGISYCLCWYVQNVSEFIATLNVVLCFENICFVLLVCLHFYLSAR